MFVQEDGDGPALQGVRVLDLTRVLAGPFATMILGDLGAEVIKVEPPEGDILRSTGPFISKGESYYYNAFNRNKRSVVIDLKTEEGIGVLLDLVRRSDVLIENFRPGVMQRMGLSPERLLAANPKLTICAISGFGQDGPLAHKSSFDVVTQAMSGAMSITGEPGRAPVRTGLPIGDQVGGMWAAMGILAALHRRHRTQKGTVLDISLLDAMVGLLGYLPGIYFATGQDPEPVGSGHHEVYPYGGFKAKDGWLILALFNSDFWTRFCRLVGRDDLATDQRFLRTRDRSENRGELTPTIEAIIATRTVSEWNELLDGAGIPNAPILTVSQVLRHPQVEHRRMIGRQVLSRGGESDIVASPLQHSSAGASTNFPAPRFGQHTRSVLQDLLGYAKDEIDQLTQRGIVHDSKTAGAKRR